MLRKVQSLSFLLLLLILAAVSQQTPGAPFDVEARKRPKRRAGEIECDEALFEQLRVLRRKLADERDVPAYVIFSDVSLREMSRVYPTTFAEFGRIPGVGQQKLRDFSEPFTSAIRGYLTSNPHQPRVSNQRG